MNLTFWTSGKFLGRRKQWWWTLTAANYEVVGGSTEGYSNFSEAVANAERVLGFLIDTKTLSGGQSLDLRRGDGASFHVTVES